MKRKRSNFGASHTFLLFQSVPLMAAMALALGGCEFMGLSEPSVPGISSVTSMFDKKQEPLPGRRISVIKAEEKGAISGPESAGPIALPPAVVNASWSQPGGAASNAPGHLSVGQNPRTIWTVDAGEGSAKRKRLTAIPIVYDGKIFTMDSEGTVRAISTANGGVVWRVATVPDAKTGFDFLHPFNSNNVARAGFGGGIAADAGKIFVATGYGTVLALDANSGSPVWTKKLDIPIREAPTAAEGRVFVVNSESELFCFNAADGSQLWTQKGLPENAALSDKREPRRSRQRRVCAVSFGRNHSPRCKNRDAKVDGSARQR